MKLQYDDDFVEGAVFLCANDRRRPAPPLQVRRFHAAREKLYSLLDPDERNAAFFRLHLEWFREWGLERQLLEVADEFPRLRTALDALVFRKARVKRDEGAELYVRDAAGPSAPPSRSAVVALRVERFEQPDDLARFLRHEFAHVDDMLNPAFGYAPQLSRSARNAAQRRLSGERYRLLWDISIDGRLAASRPAAGSREHHRAAFDRAFGFWPERKREEVFARLWWNPHPRHDELVAIASDPRDLQSIHEPSPGASCPLCGFPTFDWADANVLEPQTAAGIRREFPHWTPDQGACRRCIEIYRRAGLQSAAAP